MNDIWAKVGVGAVGVILAVLLYLRTWANAKREATLEHRIEDLTKMRQIEENSNASATAAEDRRDPAADSNPSVVSGADLPDWLRRS